MLWTCVDRVYQKKREDATSETNVNLCIGADNIRSIVELIADKEASVVAIVDQDADDNEKKEFHLIRVE